MSHGDKASVIGAKDEYGPIKSHIETDSKSKPRVFLQATVGGIVAAGLLVAWIIGYLNPILTAENKVNEQQNKVALLKIDEQKVYIQRIKTELDFSIKTQKRELEVLQAENLLLQEQLAEAKKSLEKMVSTSEQPDKVNAEIRQISKSEEAVKNSAERIKEQIDTVSKERQQVLPISWVKPSDWIGRHYHLEIEKGIYLWPIMLNAENREAKIIINTSSVSRDDGEVVLAEQTIVVGKPLMFEYKGSKYSLKLLSIRKAGSLPTNAGYFEAEKI